MRILILIIVLMGCPYFLPGQDSLFLPSGEIIEGDIVTFHKDWVVIRPTDTNHPVEIARKGTTYRLGEDYLVRSPWSIGFCYGRTFLGTRQSLQTVFEEHGFALNEPYYGKSPFDPKRSPVIQIEIEHVLTRQGAVGASLGFLNSGHPGGSKLITENEHGYIGVKHRTWSIAPYYKWFSGNRTVHLFGGPVLGFNRLEYYSSQNLHSDAPLTLGIAGGAAYSLMEKRRAFLRLSVQYHWTPSISFGPLGRIIDVYNGEEQPISEYYEYLPRTKVRASYLTVSAIYGWKFGS